MKFLFALVMLTSSAFALDCPKKIRAEAKDFSSVSAMDFELIEGIYKQGDKQTSKEYIQTVLFAANNLTAVNEVLVLSKKYSSNDVCTYNGKTGSLRIFPVGSQYANKGYTSVLTIGKINYEGPGNPTSHKGFAVDVVSHLKKFELSNVVIAKAISTLSFELNIQIPLGDYGTDGYSETMKIGKAKTVNYTVVK